MPLPSGTGGYLERKCCNACLLLSSLLSWLAMIFGAVTLWLWLPKRYKHHIDYRQRWEYAVALLGVQGQLTDEQVGLIHWERQAPPETTTAETLRMLHSMASGTGKLSR